VYDALVSDRDRLRRVSDTSAWSGSASAQAGGRRGGLTTGYLYDDVTYVHDDVTYVHDDVSRPDTRYIYI